MKLTCMVCQELLVPSDNVKVAPCGHCLHNTCWIEWLERSESCPQCRAKTTSRQLVKLFLNVVESEVEDDKPDVATYTIKIDSLSLELRCKNEDMENSKKLIGKTTKENIDLKEELLKFRNEADEAKLQCATLQEKIRDLQRQKIEVEVTTKREFERLHSQNQRLNNMVNYCEQRRMCFMISHLMALILTFVVISSLILVYFFSGVCARVRLAELRHHPLLLS